MKKYSRWSLPAFIVIASTIWFARLNHPIATAAQNATLEPTETAIPLVTPTLLPSSTPAVRAAVDWSDVSVYKKAMKPGFEGDVDQFVNANRYLIAATLSFEQDAIIRGAERVRFTNHTSQTLKELVFRLYPNAPALAGQMNVTRVTVGDQVVQPSLFQLDSVMSVPLSQPLAQNASVELQVDFNVVMTQGLDASYGRFGYVHNVVSGTAWYPTLSVYDEGLGWWKSIPSPAGDPAYTEIGLYDVRLTTPADVTVAMSGKEIETTQNTDGTVTHRNVTGPMRDHAFMASKRYTITSIEVNGTKINAVHYKDPADPNVDGTDDALKYAKFAIQIYSKTFGDYPYAEFDVVQNPTPTGVEFPGLIQIAERAWRKGSAYLEIVVAHEVGHQWFYAMVGNNQVEHPWLDESLTSYTEFVYMRAAYPNGSQADDYIQNFQKEYAAFTGGGILDQPLDLPVSSYSTVAYGAIVYRKGPLFLVELERQLGGRDVVYKMLSDYFKVYRYKVATTAGIEKSFEATSGKDLSALFQKWV
ncbi:MAG: M1 family metallopeptidase, partial [Chloroflexota bacterium]